MSLFFYSWCHMVLIIRLDAYFWARWVLIKNLNHNVLCSGEGVAALTLRRWGWGLLGRAAVSRGRAMIHQLGRRVAAHLLRVAGGVMFNGWVRVHDLQRARIRWLSYGFRCRDALCFAILLGRLSFFLTSWWDYVGFLSFSEFLKSWSNSDAGVGLCCAPGQIVFRCRHFVGVSLSRKWKWFWW